MCAATGKKLFPLMILQILRDDTDDDHHLLQKEIVEKLEKIYGIKCDRRSVRSNIEALQEFSRGRDVPYEISMERGCCLSKRLFEEAELRLLIDSVLSSRTLTERQSKRLIEKLQRLGNRYFRQKVRHVANLPGIRKADSKRMMSNVDRLNDAIGEKRQVSFCYQHYNMNRVLAPKRKEPYLVNPYQMILSQGWYYLVANVPPHRGTSNFRIDKMKDIQILKTPVQPYRSISEDGQDFDLSRYLAEHIYMFSGPSVEVKFRAQPTLMDQMVDWFGHDFPMEPEADGSLVATVRMNEMAMYYWSMLYLSEVEILSPAGLREKVEDAVLKRAEKIRQQRSGAQGEARDD